MSITACEHRSNLASAVVADLQDRGCFVEGC